MPIQGQSDDPTSIFKEKAPGIAQPRLEKPYKFIEDEPEIFPIPPVIERPLGVDEGPRIIVNAFVLKGAIDRPDEGIWVAEIEAFLEKQRLAKPRGFTVGQLQVTANMITRIYRSAGFILAQAFVPQQTVESGSVIIQVLEGTLGRVISEDNHRYSLKQLIWPFRGLIDQPVHKDSIEEALLVTTGYPGLIAFGVFRPGLEVGSTDLVLKVREERLYDVSLRLDNHGTDFTGEYRANVDINVNNLLGRADRLSANILQTLRPANGLFGALNYELPLFYPKGVFGVGISRNDFSIGQNLASLEISGTTDIASVHYNYEVTKSRIKNTYGQLDFSRKRTVVENLFGPTVENLSVLGFDFGFNFVDRRFKGVNQGRLGYYHGFADLLGASPRPDRDARGASIAPTPEFDKFTYQLARMQSLGDEQSILLRVDGQVVSNRLISLEQMAIGGPNSVRAYSTSEFLRDNATFASLEWIFRSPGFSDFAAFSNRTWGEIFQFSTFVDYATGQNKRVDSGDDRSVELLGYGLGLQLNLPGKLFCRVDISKPIGEPDASNGKQTQFYFNVRYDF